MYFQIEGSNVRLGGSMHMVPAGRALPEWVGESIGWARHIFIEQDTAHWDQLSRLPPGEVIRDRLPNSWPRIEAAHPGVAAGYHFRMPGWVALAVSFDGVPVDRGCELIARARAVNEGKSFGYLEAEEVFHKLAERIPDALWDQLIGWTLDQPDMAPKVFERLYEAWSTGDLEAVKTLATESLLGRVPEIREVVLIERNRLWMPVITELVATAREPTLVLVGAGHLVGLDGLVALLAAQGFRLQRLI